VINSNSAVLFCDVVVLSYALVYDALTWLHCPQMSVVILVMCRKMCSLSWDAVQIFVAIVLSVLGHELCNKLCSEYHFKYMITTL
jgi:hypothetical protein